MTAYNFFNVVQDPGADYAKEKLLTYFNGGAIIPPQLPFEIHPLENTKVKFTLVYYHVDDSEMAVGESVDPSSPSKGRTYSYKYSSKKNSTNAN